MTLNKDLSAGLDKSKRIVDTQPDSVQQNFFSTVASPSGVASQAARPPLSRKPSLMRRASCFNMLNTTPNSTKEKVPDEDQSASFADSKLNSEQRSFFQEFPLQPKKLEKIKASTKSLVD